MVVIPSLLKKNHWKISSLYDLQFYNCPDCDFKVQDKQNFINHACDTHPNCIDYLHTIRDGSLSGVICPWIFEEEEEEEDIKIGKNWEELSKKLPKSISLLRMPKVETDVEVLAKKLPKSVSILKVEVREQPAENNAENFDIMEDINVEDEKDEDYDQIKDENFDPNDRKVILKKYKWKTQTKNRIK